jgi:hypothetical protein
MGVTAVAVMSSGGRLASLPCTFALPVQLERRVIRYEITTPRTPSLAAASMALALLLGSGAGGAAEEPLEKVNATSVNMTAPAATAGRLEIAARELSRVGTIRTPTSLARDLHFARSHKLDDGGRRMVLVTDRPMAPGKRRTDHDGRRT